MIKGMKKKPNMNIYSLDCIEHIKKSPHILAGVCFLIFFLLHSSTILINSTTTLISIFFIFFMDLGTILNFGAYISTT